jgi:hypothetical protein
MARICIVEPQAHQAPGTLARRLPELGDFTVRTVDAVPEVLDDVEALVLNNIGAEHGAIPEQRVVAYVEGCGGVFKRGLPLLERSV